jgi:c(7)-type cytochrome triheme protein
MKYCTIIFVIALLLVIENTAFAVNVRDVTLVTRNAGTVLFSHTVHLGNQGMARNCRACHDAIFDLKKKRHYSMAEMEKGKSCGACHDGRKAFGLDSCLTCHRVKEITYAVKETGPTHFSHKVHAGIARCEACHPKLYSPNQKNRRVLMAAMEKGRSCGACHNSKQSFSVKECAKCHPTKAILFEEKSTGNVVFSHISHTALYTCGDCHASLFKTARGKVRVSMQEMEGGRSCGRCHDGKTAFSVKDTCEACHKNN